MNRINSILVPFDFSLESDNALKYAHAIARKANAIVDLFNATPVPNDHMDLGENEREMLLKEKRELNWKRLNEVATHPKFDDCKIRINQLDMIEGESLEEIIVKAAKLNESNLIVTGTKGIEGISQLALASNSSQLVTVAPCPVFIVKHYDSEVNMDNILFASEFIEEDDDKSIVLFELAKLYDSKITLAQVDGTGDMSAALRDLPIARFAEKFALDRDQMICHEEFPIEKGIFNLSTDLKANLVVLGYHEDRVKDHVFYGSIAEDFVNHTAFNILVLPM